MSQWPPALVARISHVTFLPRVALWPVVNVFAVAPLMRASGCGISGMICPFTRGMPQRYLSVAGEPSNFGGTQVNRWVLRLTAARRADVCGASTGVGFVMKLWKADTRIQTAG